MIDITDNPILPQKVLDELPCNISGSVVLHMGIVRPSSEGRQVKSIEYGAINKQAKEELAAISDEIKNKWEIQDVALIRRTGNLALGEIILVAVISAPHRKAAFEACQYAVEKLRGMTTMKKREIYE